MKQKIYMLLVMLMVTLTGAKAADAELVVVDGYGYSASNGSVWVSFYQILNAAYNNAYAGSSASSYQGIGKIAAFSQNLPFSAGTDTESGVAYTSYTDGGALFIDYITDISKAYFVSNASNYSGKLDYGIRLRYRRSGATEHSVTVTVRHTSATSVSKTVKLIIKPGTTYQQKVRFTDGPSSTTAVTTDINAKVGQGVTIFNYSPSSGARSYSLSAVTSTGAILANASISPTSATGSGTKDTYFTTATPGTYKLTVRQSGVEGSYFPSSVTRNIVVTYNTNTITISNSGAKTVTLENGTSVSLDLASLATTTSGNKGFTYTITPVSTGLTSSDYSRSGNTFTAMKAGTYKIAYHLDARDSYGPADATLTLTVLPTPSSIMLKTSSLNMDARESMDLASLIESHVGSNNFAYSIKSALDPDGNTISPSAGNYTLAGATFTPNKVGTYVISYKQSASTQYAESTASLSIIVTDIHIAFLKPMSCVINEIDLTDAAFDYPGYQNMDVDWAANARNLRYVKTNRTYAQIPQNYLNDQIVLKTTDEDVVESGKIIIGGGSSEVIVSNPVLSDEAQFDYVFPNNFRTKLRFDFSNHNTVTFTRNGFPGKNAKGQYTYGTICLPFDVDAADMPDGFKFEEYVENITKEDGMRYSVFQEVTYLVAGLPYLVYNTGSTNADLTIKTHTSYVWASHAYPNSFFMGTYVNLIFDDINSNTSANPYNNVGASCADGFDDHEAEHKGELNFFFNTLYNYNSDGYLMANPGGDKIKKSSKTVRNKTMLRPFRAYFLLAKDAPAGAKAMAVMHLGLDDEATGISYLDAEGKEVEIVDVYTTGGVRIAKDKPETEALEGLPAGLYILSNGKKVSKK